MLYTLSVDERAGSFAARRRRISIPAGQALDRLGHAIAYLTDEHFHAGESDRSSDWIESVEILKRLYREVLSECP
jgi:hypothetical protein